MRIKPEYFSFERMMLPFLMLSRTASWFRSTTSQHQMKLPIWMFSEANHARALSRSPFFEKRSSAALRTTLAQSRRQQAVSGLFDVDEFESVRFRLVIFGLLFFSGFDFRRQWVVPGCLNPVGTLALCDFGLALLRRALVGCFL